MSREREQGIADKMHDDEFRIAALETQLAAAQAEVERLKTRIADRRTLTTNENLLMKPVVDSAVRIRKAQKANDAAALALAVADTYAAADVYTAATGATDKLKLKETTE